MTIALVVAVLIIIGLAIGLGISVHNNNSESSGEFIRKATQNYVVLWISEIDPVANSFLGICVWFDQTWYVQVHCRIS